MCWYRWLSCVGIGGWHSHVRAFQARHGDKTTTTKSSWNKLKQNIKFSNMCCEISITAEVVTFCDKIWRQTISRYSKKYV